MKAYLFGTQSSALIMPSLNTQFFCFVYTTGGIYSQFIVWYTILYLMGITRVFIVCNKHYNKIMFNEAMGPLC